MLTAHVKIWITIIKSICSTIKVGVLLFYGSGFSSQNVSQLLISVIVCDGGFHFSVLPKQSADLTVCFLSSCTNQPFPTNRFKVFVITQKLPLCNAAVQGKVCSFSPTHTRLIRLTSDQWLIGFSLAEAHIMAEHLVLVLLDYFIDTMLLYRTEHASVMCVHL